jgi:hypothetical protein
MVFAGPSPVHEDEHRGSGDEEHAGDQHGEQVVEEDENQTKNVAPDMSGSSNTAVPSSNVDFQDNGISSNSSMNPLLAVQNY